MPYIGRTLGQGTRSRFLYTATAGQTTFSGSDSQSNTLSYADNNGLDCFQNGVLLKGGGADYTATTGTSVVLTTGASVNDVIEILVYDVFAIADHVKKSGDAMTGALTNIDVNGTELILDADGDTSITADTDDQVDIKVGGSDKVTINSSGIGIGNTSPDQLLNLGNTSSSQPILQFLSSTSGANTIHFGDGSSTDAYRGYINYAHNNDSLQFASAGSERMRVDSGGDFRIGIPTQNPGAGTRGTIVTQDNGILITGFSEALRIYSTSSGSPNASITANGVLSKSSGSFKIDHPLESKKDTHYLVHSFVEAPEASNIYRGKVTLSSGSATVNVDTVSGMTEGTFVALNTDVQCFTSNESGWTAIKGSVSGNTLTITAQDNSCTDTISWMIVGRRHDPHMKDSGTDWTDSDGRVIVEPEKESG